jgi:hypothetical protein
MRDSFYTVKVHIIGEAFFHCQCGVMLSRLQVYIVFLQNSRTDNGELDSDSYS